MTGTLRLAALVLGLGTALPGMAQVDTLSDAAAAAAAGECTRAAPLYEAVLAEPAAGLRKIEAGQGLALCLADGAEPWRAREIMAELLPVVLKQFGPASGGLARHHAIWAEVELRAGALNVAWRRSEAAIGALRAAGQLDPFEYSAEIYRLAAIQSKRGEGDAFLAFLDAEVGRAGSAQWAAPGDGELFGEVIGTPPGSGAPEALRLWARGGLEELDPRPIYLDLVAP
ncbi:hypothetical protein H0I76_02455 [Limibaculum sp. M0105]|uniref:Uncharacterized protein n=1 Tax=Thermohalobaculum xanthum TaxID=2753746 RepID=A0A8J7M4D2_9RHOB|nr:hypothetical protein [Thermohalobaculum xanthum]MBK0398039.1 hypothetical protein [Thermohalobaculum xanthum]